MVEYWTGGIHLKQPVASIVRDLIGKAKSQDCEDNILAIDFLARKHNN